MDELCFANGAGSFFFDFWSGARFYGELSKHASIVRRLPAIRAEQDVIWEQGLNGKIVTADSINKEIARES